MTPGLDQLDPDPERLQLVHQRLGEPLDGPLRGVIEAQEREGQPAAHRGDVDDRARSADPGSGAAGPGSSPSGRRRWSRTGGGPGRAPGSRTRPRTANPALLTSTSIAPNRPMAASTASADRARVGHVEPEGRDPAGDSQVAEGLGRPGGRRDVPALRRESSTVDRPIPLEAPVTRTVRLIATSTRFGGDRGPTTGRHDRPTSAGPQGEPAGRRLDAGSAPGIMLVGSPESVPTRPECTPMRNAIAAA